MKKIVLGGALFVGGVGVGMEVFKRMLLSTINDKAFMDKILDERWPIIERKLADVLGEEKVSAIKAIIES